MSTTINQKLDRRDLIRFTNYGIAALLLIVMDMTILEFFAIANISPDFLIILIVWIALREGQFRAVFAGFLIGLLSDVLTIDVIGTNALTKTIVGFAAGYFFKEDEIRKRIGSFFFLLIVLGSSLIHNLFYLFFYLKYSEASFLLFYLKYGMASALYTTIIAIFPMLFKIARK